MDGLRPTVYPNPTSAPNGTCLSTEDGRKEDGHQQRSAGTIPR